MRSRALRRHHEERIKERVKSYYGGYVHDARQIGKLAHARTPCSCWMCGNPRKYDGEVTMQEKRRRSPDALDTV